MNISKLLSFFRPSKAPDEPFSLASDQLNRAAHHMSSEGLLVSYGCGFEPAPGAAASATLNPDQSDPSKRFKTSPAPQHPLAPEKNPPPLDWDRWSSMARENQRRGWSFTRYAARGPTGQMACLFGIVRGPFGIAKMDFYVCRLGYGTLHVITHLPSGIGCGLFADQQAAATACEITARLSGDWELIDLHQDAAGTCEAMLHMHQAWAAAGIVKSASHAHATADTDSARLPIWIEDHSTIVMGRPEKLS